MSSTTDGLNIEAGDELDGRNNNPPEAVGQIRELTEPQTILNFDFSGDYQVNQDTNAANAFLPFVLDSDHDEFTFRIGAEPLIGSVTYSEDGNFTYTANPYEITDGKVLEDNFTYIANDGFNDSNEAEITIRIEPLELVFTLTTSIDTSMRGEFPRLLDRGQIDNFSAQTSNSYRIISEPENGIVEAINLFANDPYASEAYWQYNYIPNPGFSGKDAFSYGENLGGFTYMGAELPTLGADISTIQSRSAVSTIEILVNNPATDDFIQTTEYFDTIIAGEGADLVRTGWGGDTIYLSSSETWSSLFVALNLFTDERISLEGLTRFSSVLDGQRNGAQIYLNDGANGNAFFLHDSYSAFHSALNLAEDFDSRFGTQRIKNIEEINSGGGDDVIDLTSPDYSLAGQNIKVDSGTGNDVVWGSDADEIIIGGDGNDELFGGAGTNVLTGGAGADEFQFTMTSTNDSVTDFNAAEGDTLKFFNTGGATFDIDSVTANSASDGISIEYSYNDQVQSLNISLGLSSSSVTNDLLSAIEII